MQFVGRRGDQAGEIETMAKGEAAILIMKAAGDLRKAAASDKKAPRRIAGKRRRLSRKRASSTKPSLGTRQAAVP